MNYFPGIRLFLATAAAVAALSTGCGRKLNAGSYEGSASTAGYQPKNLPPPHATASAQNFSRVTGWGKGEMPAAPTGFTVTRFADGFDHPRWVYEGPNGDIFVAESTTILKGIKKIGARLSRKIKTQHYGTSANRVMLLRDEDHDGVAEKKFVFISSQLNQPFGMLIIGNKFYVANTNGLMVFDYHAGDTAVTGKGTTIHTYPGSGRHWARNIISNRDQSKIYIGMGSSSNVAEKGLDKELRRACILEINPDGSGEKIYASGLRNPCGMAWAPGTNSLWAAVNERDELGDELVPDYLTHVQQGGFYGWPYSYYGQHADPRMKDHPDSALVARAIVPDYPVGSHTASLGLAFYEKKSFPEHYRNGAFITQHGSWNRSVLSGYKVIYVPFAGDKPSGAPEDFLTGFAKNVTNGDVHGRPVGIAVTKEGALLVSDDVSNTVWCVRAKR